MTLGVFVDYELQCVLAFDHGRGSGVRVILKGGLYGTLTSDN